MARILLIDDEVRVAQSIARSLRIHHDVVVVNTLEELLALEGEFDIILSDYNLGFSGHPTSSEILPLLDVKLGERIPLVLISANAGDKATQNSPVGKRAKRILAKPTSRDNLFEAIAAALAVA